MTIAFYLNNLFGSLILGNKLLTVREHFVLNHPIPWDKDGAVNHQMEDSYLNHELET